MAERTFVPSSDILKYKVDAIIRHIIRYEGISNKIDIV